MNKNKTGIMPSCDGHIPDGPTTQERGGGMSLWAFRLIRIATVALVLATTTIATMSKPASAASLGLDFKNSALTFNQSGNTLFTFGYGFTLTQEVNLSGLGLWDADANGVHVDAKVGLWRVDGTLLHNVGATDLVRHVSSAAGAPGDWLFANTDIDLGPGSYRIGAVNDLRIFGNGGVLSVDTIVNPLLTISIATLFASNPSSFSLTDPSTSEAGSFLGANIELSAVNPVPIPAALPLFLSGLLGLGVIARRRKKIIA